MTTGSGNIFTKLTLTEGSVPATPAAGNQSLFIDSADHLLKAVNSSAAVSEMGGSGSALAASSISPTTANVTAVVATRYFANVSGLTANRNFILPTCAAGDEIELKITTGDDTYALVLIGDTGVSIDGGSTATEWSRLFISGEVVRFIADASNSWQVVHDGRKPCIGKMSLSAADTTSTISTDTLPTWDTAVINIGNLCDLTNKRFNVRRAGTYSAGSRTYPNATLSDTNTYQALLKNGSTDFGSDITRASGSGGHFTANANGIVTCVAGDPIYLYYFSNISNAGINANGLFWIQEIL